MTLRTVLPHWSLLAALLIGTGFPGISGCAEDSAEQSADEVGSDSVPDLSPDRESAVGTEDSVEAAAPSSGGAEGASGTLYLHRAKETVGRSIPSVLIESVEVDGSAMLVQLTENEAIPAYTDYYEVADQRNRIIAIESVRWFRDLPALQTIHLQIPSAGGTMKVTLDREKVAEYYGISLRSLAEHPDEKYWRENFLVRWDTDAERAKFAETFTSE